MTEPGARPPDPANIEVVIATLREFIRAVSWKPGPPGARRRIGLGPANRLQRALADVGVDGRWRDGPGEVTAGGQLSSYLARVADTMAAIMGRAGAERVDGLWKPPEDMREDRIIFALPSEMRGLDDAIRGLVEGVDAMKKGGPNRSLNPMHSDEPIRPPDLGHLESLNEAIAHWLKVARLREGEGPREERRDAIIKACGHLWEFLTQFKRDLRWGETTRYKILSDALQVVNENFHEVTGRGRLLTFQDGRMEFVPGEMIDGEDGSHRSPPAPLYLGFEAAKFVERALLDLREVLEEFRPEALTGRPPHARAARQGPIRAGDGDETSAARFDARVKINARRRSISVDGVEAVIDHPEGFRVLRLLFESRGKTVSRKKIREVLPECPQRIRPLLRRIDLKLAGAGCGIEFSHMVDSSPGQGGGYFATFKYVDSFRGAQ